jgi:hypothetical protein
MIGLGKYQVLALGDAIESLKEKAREIGAKFSLCNLGAEFGERSLNLRFFQVIRLP